MLRQGDNDSASVSTAHELTVVRKFVFDENEGAEVGREVGSEEGRTVGAGLGLHEVQMKRN